MNVQEKIDIDPSITSCSINTRASLSGTKVTIVKDTTGTTTYYN